MVQKTIANPMVWMRILSSFSRLQWPPTEILRRKIPQWTPLGQATSQRPKEDSKGRLCALNNRLKLEARVVMKYSIFPQWNQRRERSQRPRNAESKLKENRMALLCLREKSYSRQRITSPGSSIRTLKWRPEQSQIVVPAHHSNLPSKCQDRLNKPRNWRPSKLSLVGSESKLKW